MRDESHGRDLQASRTESAVLATEYGKLPKAELAFPGTQRDRLVKLILDGTKTLTTALLIDYTESGEALPAKGNRSILVDSAGKAVALLETTDVAICRLGEVSERDVRDEGEGDATVQQWRRNHEAFWNSNEYRASFTDSSFSLSDDTAVVLERFRVVERL